MCSAWTASGRTGQKTRKDGRKAGRKAKVCVGVRVRGQTPFFFFLVLSSFWCSCSLVFFPSHNKLPRCQGTGLVHAHGLPSPDD
jgi:hypothetical protein